MLVAKANNTGVLLKDWTLCRLPDDVTRSLFEESVRAIGEDDMCPVCFNELMDGSCLSCPACKNYVHKDCMLVWLERKDTCVYCRSNVWARYPLST